MVQRERERERDTHTHRRTDRDRDRDRERERERDTHTHRTNWCVIFLHVFFLIEGGFQGGGGNETRLNGKNASLFQFWFTLGWYGLVLG